MNADRKMGKTWWLAGGFLLALILGGVLALVLSGLREGNTPAAEPVESPVVVQSPERSTTASSSPAEEPASGRACERPERQTAGSAAPDVKWTFVGTVKVPYSTALGPSDQAEGLRQCYEHSPEGAVVAYFNYASALTAREIRAYGVPSDLREQVAEALDAASGKTPLYRLEPRGYRVENYTGESAVVRSVMWVDEKQHLETAGAFMVWADGDWKIDYEKSTGIGGKREVVPTTEGYTEWGGQ